MFDRHENGGDFDAPQPLEESAGPPAEQRCPACLTTWETLRRDGRAGCPACYSAFREALGLVMNKVQRGDVHTGKTPRAALKRARRGVNLAKRRENQLELLQSRLQAAVAGERFEEAAALRDKIEGLS